MKKLLIFLFCVFGFLVACFVLFCHPPTGASGLIQWGVTFSKPWASEMGLDWRETYLAILDELKPKAVRLPIYWQDVEPQSGQYVFDDYDWLTQEAQKRNVKLILVIGRKLPRWPECHLPDWAAPLNTVSQERRMLNLLPEIIRHFQDLNNLAGWQIENEPFFAFGNCPKQSADFLEKEVGLARSLDSSHPIITTDSGEFGFWWRAAKQADIFGATMYRIIWDKRLGYVKYPFPPQFFWVKANLLRVFYPKKSIIVSELQAEPWGPKPNYDLSLEEQAKSMNAEQFYDNVAYARRVGFSEAYFWGAEWWYWMKEKQEQPEMWEAVKKIMSGE